VNDKADRLRAFLLFFFERPLLQPYKARRNDDVYIPPSENPFHMHHLEGHTSAVRAIAAHGKYCVSGSYDSTVRVWDIVKGTCLHVLKGHEQKGEFDPSNRVRFRD
jgi:WD40 repeat protein